MGGGGKHAVTAFKKGKKEVHPQKGKSDVGGGKRGQKTPQ